jgi:hypothetical protein
MPVPFNNIGLISETTTIVTNTLSTLSNKASSISTNFNDLLSVSISPPTGYFKTTVEIFPSFPTIPTMPEFSNPIQDMFNSIVPAINFPGDLDFCHAPSISTSMLSIMMSAISVVVSQITGSISDVITKASTLFGDIVNFVNGVYVWLENICIDMYNSIKKSIREFNIFKDIAIDSNDTVRVSLWDRAIKFIKGVLRTIVDKIKIIKEDIIDFVDLLKDARDVIIPKINIIIESIPGWSSDVSCLTKNITKVFA